MVRKIKVKNSGLIKLQVFDDFPDGNLIIGEANKSVPFSIKRVYYINNLYNRKAERGKHAHKTSEQIIFCINGHFTLTLDDGEKEQSISMNNPIYGVRLGPKLWHTMTRFSSDCVILVLANDYFNENDYIRNYQDFLNYVKK
ncbi:MAG: FdtA/QdtA family cupin domain-containing protein [Rectinema sp.]